MKLGTLMTAQQFQLPVLITDLKNDKDGSDAE
jgi:hypothetical protein